MPTQVWLHVHVGYPRDYADARHASLFFVFSNNTRCVMHVIGWPGEFYFDLIDNYDPLASQSMATRIFVAAIPDTYSRSAIRDIVSGTRVNNGPDDSFWDCQQWVCDALVRLERFGALTKHQKDRSIDSMIYACLEAQDEGVALLRKQAMNEQAIIEKKMTDQASFAVSLTEESLTGQAMTEQAMTEQAIIEKVMTEDETTEEKMTEQASSVESLTEELLTGQTMTKEAMIEETRSNS